MKKNSWVGKSLITWKEIDLQVKLLVKNIQKTGFEFDRIATVTRGGLVPARLVADQFDIKKILVDRPKIYPGTLFVDDIYDTGDTFKKVIPKVVDKQNFVFATLVARKGSRYPKQLVYATKTRGKEYVVFPWDRLEYERKHGKSTSK